MTKKDLIYALERGLGRAYLAVKEKPENETELVKLLAGTETDKECEKCKEEGIVFIFESYDGVRIVQISPEMPQYSEYSDVLYFRFTSFIKR